MSDGGYAVFVFSVILLFSLTCALLVHLTGHG